MTSNNLSALQNHLRHYRQYRDNALDALQHGDAGKAGELLWGSVAQPFHAVAVFFDKQIRTHRDLKNFAIQLARELNDPDIEKDFIIAESLRHNFYDIQQENADIAIALPVIEELTNKLFALILTEFADPASIAQIQS